MRSDLKIPVGVVLDGILIVPDDVAGFVVFSHGSGSSRFSPRNSYIAEELQRRSVATLLFDLLTEDEDEVYSQRFDIDLLSERLIKVTQWVTGLPQLKGLPLGYFGASTGAASALTAAARLPDIVKAVVSRGGRPDLSNALALVKAPTLLIVGGHDTEVMRLNDQASDRLTCIHELHEVEGATHLFEELGALEEVARLAGDWFIRYLKNTNQDHNIKKNRRR